MMRARHALIQVLGEGVVTAAAFHTQHRHLLQPSGPRNAAARKKRTTRRATQTPGGLRGPLTPSSTAAAAEKKGKDPVSEEEDATPDMKKELVSAVDEELTATAEDAANNMDAVAVNDSNEVTHESHQRIRKNHRLLLRANTAIGVTSACPDSRLSVPRLQQTPIVLHETPSTGNGAPLTSLELQDQIQELSSVESMSGPLPTGDAVELFANTFALTLHSTTGRQRYLAMSGLAASTFAPPTGVTPSSAPARDAFLSSPYVVSHTTTLTSRSPFFTSAMMEDEAPLHWLEVSFSALCRRLATELHATTCADSLEDEEEAQDFHTAVREEADQLLEVMAKKTKCVASSTLMSMRRQRRGESETAAAAAATVAIPNARQRRSRRLSPTPATASEHIEDTLQHTLERVALELHLIRAYLIRLGEQAGAPVEEVARQALSWSRTVNSLEEHNSNLSVSQLEWMLATALLERIHTQPYHFHHAKPAPPIFLGEGAAVAAAVVATNADDAPSLSPAAVTEEKNLYGLATLVDYALAERILFPASQGRLIARLDEALLSLMVGFHAVLPLYAALQPAWQQTARRKAAASTKEEGEEAQEEEEEEEVAIMAAAVAAPTAVFTVIVDYYIAQEALVRQEGGPAALWWLRLLPLWLDSASRTLELQLVVTALAGTGAASSAQAEPVMVASLDALLVKVGEHLRDVLRSDRGRCEQALAQRTVHLLRNQDRDAFGHTSRSSALLGDQSGGNNSVAGQSTKSAKTGEAPTDAAEEKDNKEKEDSASVTPREGVTDATEGVPLSRRRGKRSLFYKEPGDGKLPHHQQQQQRSSSASTAATTGRGRSRFTSRTRGTSPAGHTAGGSGLGAGASSSYAVGASSSQDSSAFVEVLVVAEETPSLLAHHSGVGTMTTRYGGFEEAWAAAAHTRHALWRLLYAPALASGLGTSASSAEEMDVEEVSEEVRELLQRVLPPSVAVLLFPAGEGEVVEASARELTLRKLLVVLRHAQQRMSLATFESLDHVIVSVAAILLHIHTIGMSSNSAMGGVGGGTGMQARQSAFARSARQLSDVLAVGATALMSDSTHSWSGMIAACQLRRMTPLATPLTPLAASPATHAFAVQWASALMRSMPFLPSCSREEPRLLLKNAQEVLRVLQSPELAVMMPLYAKQVSAAMLLQSLDLMSLQWEQYVDDGDGPIVRKSGTVARRRMKGHTEVPPVEHADILALCNGLLEVLRLDVDLRLLCCYAAFLEGLYEVHNRLRVDHAALVAWTDIHLLPLALPIVTDGLRRSQATSSAAAHADLCETTLGLLSPLSRFAANSKVGLSDVLRTQWNEILLQVSLYCVRLAGRSGAKRSSEHDTPSVSLPDLQQMESATAAATRSGGVPVVRSPWWTATFAGGAEAVFVNLLDRSNIVWNSLHRVEPRDVDAADGLRVALTAFVGAWAGRVRFSGRVWPNAQEGPTASGGSEDGEEGEDGVPKRFFTELLRSVHGAATAAQAFTALTAPAYLAGAEAAPFLAAKPFKARQLGYLVRFMEHFLRERERASSLNDEELQAALDTSAVPTSSNATTSSQGATPGVVSARMSSHSALGEAAPLVLMDFVGHLTSAGGWAMVTWTLNIAETVVIIELKHHRHIPAAARAVAATAVLSQLRVVPPPDGVSQLSSNLLKALPSFSDLVATQATSLLGFYRRSPTQGLLGHPTRDQLRVLTFGLKQAVTYVQADAHRFTGRRMYGAASGAAASAPVEGEDRDQESDDELEEEHGRGLAVLPRGASAEDRLAQQAGSYFAQVWLERQRTATSEAADPAAPLAYDRNRDFRFFLSCLVCLVDGCMESVQLQLLRQQMDGEEDIRAVVEASVKELCRTFSACIRSVLTLTPAQRRTCFQQEEAELLWASLCAVATISTTAPRDQKDRFFTPRCVQSIEQLLILIGRLLEAVVGAEDSVAAAIHGHSASSVTQGGKSKRNGLWDTSFAGQRPLCTAIVHGVQLLLREPRSLRRVSIRLAMRKGDRDDLTAVLGAFQTLVNASNGYEPGRRLFLRVWERLSMELTQPLALLTSSSKNAISSFPVASVVPVRAEYAAVLQEVVAACTSVSAGSHLLTSITSSVTEGGTQFNLGLVEKAVACVEEDAAGIEAARLRGLRRVGSRFAGGGLNTTVDNDGGTVGDVPLLEVAYTRPHLALGEALVEGSITLTEALHAAVTHALAVMRLMGGRSRAITAVGSLSIARHATTGGDVVGLARLLRDFCQDMTDLVQYGTLTELLAHPKADVLLGALHILHGAVPGEAEAALWSLLTEKWQAELLDPAEGTFQRLQQRQLALVRARRTTNIIADAAAWRTRARSPQHRQSGSSRGGGGQVNDRFESTPPDIFSRAGRSGGSDASVSTAAQAATMAHVQPNPFDLPRHDDSRFLLSKGDKGSSTKEVHQGSVEMDAAATGMDALTEMPAPLSLSVLMPLLCMLSRRQDAQRVSQRASSSGRSGARQGQLREMNASLIVNGDVAQGHNSNGGTDSRAEGTQDADAAFDRFASTVLTYTARAYWLLRPRLDDHALLAWATMEKGMASYADKESTRQRLWDQLCRLRRLPTSHDHATVAAGQLLQGAERQHFMRWTTALQEAADDTTVLPTAPEQAEVAVFHYLRGLALYLDMLSLCINLLCVRGEFGYLLQATPDVVRRRLQMMQQRRPAAASPEAVAQELQRMALDRQTSPAAVNANLLETAALHFVNVSWCLLRHTDSLTHAATDLAMAQQSGPKRQRTGAAPAMNVAVAVSYTDELRRMAATVLQDTVDSLLNNGSAPPRPFMEHVVSVLLTCGLSCDPLLLPKTDTSKSSSSNSTGTVSSGGLKDSSAPHPVVSGAAVAVTAVNSVTRAELLVGSPSLLAVLSPHFIKSDICIALRESTLATALLPVTSALEFYLSLRAVPLSPLLEATTELLTTCRVRHSALHTYCERLAAELTNRADFRQALAPPTIASVDQGAAGSVSNESVIAFAAAIARQDVHVTKKTVAQLLHSIMSRRPDVFGQPPTVNRQGKLTLVQVGTSVDTTIDTTNPLYTPRAPGQAQAATSTATKEAASDGIAQEEEEVDDVEEMDGATAVMDGFMMDKWADFTAVTHRKALAALTLPLDTVIEMAMHVDAMRPIDPIERRRARQMLKAADDARRERVAMRRSQAQVAAATQKESVHSGEKRGPANALANLGELDASLHLEDPLDFGVAILHLHFALRKVVHASLRRLLHRQGPHLLAEVATMLTLVEPALLPTPTTTLASGEDQGSASPTGQRRPPVDGILAGTTRVLLSRAVQCAQAIGYDSAGAAFELPGTASESTHAVLKPPVPALQPSAIAAGGSGRTGALTKEEKAGVQRRVVMEREAAMAVGLSYTPVPRKRMRRIFQAVRATRILRDKRQKRLDYRRRRGTPHGGPGTSGKWPARGVGLQLRRSGTS